jgi:hypothetical protein
LGVGRWGNAQREFVAFPAQRRSHGNIAGSGVACTVSHVTQPAAALNRPSAVVTRSAQPPQAKLRPSSERDGRRRERRHQERLVADWLRSLASARA